MNRGPNDPNIQRTSSATNLRCRSKMPRTERAHISTIPKLAEQARQAALHTDPHKAADGASSSSVASLPGWAAGQLLGGQEAAYTQPRGPAADQRPEQGVGGKDPSTPPPPPASGAPRHRSQTRVPATRPTGLVHHGVLHPSCSTCKPPGRRGRTATTGARREWPRSGRRSDRDLRPSEIR